jgi:hypothetical protein
MSNPSLGRSLVWTLVLLVGCGYSLALSEKTLDPVVTSFETRVSDFIKLRKDAEKSAPRIDGKSTPDEIAAHRRRLAQEIRRRRSGARVGDVFGRELTARISKVVQAYLRHDGSTQRRAVEDDKPKPPEAKIVVNGPYPAEGRAMMPPDILAVLPPLPDGLEYRFVKDDLLLVDSKSQVVIDIVPAVLP